MIVKVEPVRLPRWLFWKSEYIFHPLRIQAARWAICIKIQATLLLWIYDFMLFLFSVSITHAHPVCLSGLSLTKNIFTFEGVAEESTYAGSAASAVRSPACWRSTSEHTLMSVRTFANTATLPSKPKVRGRWQRYFSSVLFVHYSVC